MEPNIYHLYNDNPYSSFSYFPNPNPNPNIPSASIGDGVILRPPGVNHYPQYPAYPQNPIPTATPAVPAAESYYYYGVHGGDSLHQQYAAQPDSFSYGIMNKVGTGNTFADLETKKWKVIQGGAPADSVRVCLVCNVVCNSDKVFASHVAGEKHALKAIGVSPGALKSKVPAHLKALHSTKKWMHLTPNTYAKKAAKSLVTYVPSSYCDVCKIDCNSQEVLNSHKMGKKHIKNMQKLQASITPKKPASAPLRIPVQKDVALVAGQAKSSVAGQPKKAPPTKEDLEIKKQKVLNGGAVADRVRVCGICNVVCNSETVFNSHIAGQKHIAQVNKQ